MELENKFGSVLPLFLYFQLNHFYLIILIGKILSTLKFEIVIKKAGKSIKGLLSKIYKVIEETSAKKEMKYQENGQNTVKEKLSSDNWRKIWSRGEMVSSVTTTKFQAFKILTFWYMTPELLSHVKKNLSPLSGKNVEKGALTSTADMSAL